MDTIIGKSIKYKIGDKVLLEGEVVRLVADDKGRVFYQIELSDGDIVHDVEQDYIYDKVNG